MTIKPPPPRPQLNGSVTPSVAAAATVASMALPPLFRMASAAFEAGSLMVATAPPVPVATGVLANAAGGRISDRMREETRAVRAGRELGLGRVMEVAGRVAGRVAVWFVATVTL